MQLLTPTSPSSNEDTQTPSPPPPASSEPSNPIWEQQPGEKDLWFERFQTYALLTKPRYIEVAYRQRQSVEPQLKKPRAPTYWFTQANTWKWEERAKAWDKFKQEQLRSMEDERRFDAREDRRQLIRQVLHRLARGIELANIPEMDEAVARRHLDTLVRAFNTMIVADRMEMGEPTSIIETTGQTDLNLKADDYVAAMRELAAEGFPVVILNQKNEN